MASPATPNLLKPQLYRDALGRVAPARGTKRAATALIIPDYAVRMAMIDLEDQNKGSWKTYVVRPAVVTNGQPMLIGLIGGWYIPNEELAAAMVDIAINGADEQTIGSAKLRAMGQALLAQA